MGGSAAVFDGAGDLCRQFRVDQKLVDERGEDLLPGHPGDSQPVGRLALPDVEGPVRRRREVDGSARPLGASLLGGRRRAGDPRGTPETETLGGCGVSGGPGG